MYRKLIEWGNKCLYIWKELSNAMCPSTLVDSKSLELESIKIRLPNFIQSKEDQFY